MARWWAPAVAVRSLVATCFVASAAVPWTGRGPGASLSGWELVGAAASRAFGDHVPGWAPLALALVPSAGLVSLVARAAARWVARGPSATVVADTALVLAAVVGLVLAGAIVLAPALTPGPGAWVVGAAALAVPLSAALPHRTAVHRTAVHRTAVHRTAVRRTAVRRTSSDRPRRPQEHSR